MAATAAAGGNPAGRHPRGRPRLLLALAPATADAARGDTTVTDGPPARGATGGVGVVAAARDLGTWLVALELATLPVIALVALRGTRSASPGRSPSSSPRWSRSPCSCSAAALWLAATGDAAFATGAVGRGVGRPASSGRCCVLAVTVLVSGLGFKLSLVPFHAWTPQAYCTARPGPSRPFLAGASKISAAAALLVVAQAVVGAAIDTGSVSVVLAALSAASA